MTEATSMAATGGQSAQPWKCKYFLESVGTQGPFLSDYQIVVFFANDIYTSCEVWMLNLI